jgi:hypothetical protein
MSKSHAPTIADAFAAMRQAGGRGRGRKSAVYEWMAEHYEELAQGFILEPPSWTALATFFTGHGMLTADGLPQTAASVRSVWVRLSSSRDRRGARSSEPNTFYVSTSDPAVLDKLTPEEKASFAAVGAARENTDEEYPQEPSTPAPAKPERVRSQAGQRRVRKADSNGTTPLTHEEIMALPEGMNAVGGGINLRVRGGSRSWVARRTKDGGQKSLCVYPAVSEAEARAKAAELP